MDDLNDLDDVVGPSRTAVLLRYLSGVPDPRNPRRVAHPLSEVLFLVVCAYASGEYRLAICDAGMKVRP